MTRKELQYVVNKAQVPFYVNKLELKANAFGYAEDKDGWFTYSVTTDKRLFKNYEDTEEHCIEDLYHDLKHVLSLEDKKLELTDRDILALIDLDNIKSLVEYELGSKIDKLKVDAVDIKQHLITFVKESIEYYYKEVPSEVSYIVV